MPVLRRKPGGEATGAATVSGGEGTLGASAPSAVLEQLRRDGASSSVVVSLLAFLTRLQRVQDPILCALRSMGVRGDCSGPDSHPPEASREAVRDDSDKNDSDEDDSDKNDSDEDDSDEDDSDEDDSDVDPLERYIAARGLKREEFGTCVAALLEWVDRVSPLDAVANPVFSRDALVSRLDAASPPTARKRRRSPAASDGDDSPERRHWGHYAAQLRAAHRAEIAVVRAVCAAGVGALLPPALWERARKRQAKGITTPGAVSLQANYKELAAAKDALAERQRDITGLLMRLEGAIEEYTEQAQKVVESEELFKRNVRLARWESEALLELSRRVKRILKSTQSV